MKELISETFMQLPGEKKDSELSYTSRTKKFRRPLLSTFLLGEWTSLGVRPSCTRHHAVVHITEACLITSFDASLPLVDPAHWIYIGCFGLGELCSGCESCALQLKHTISFAVSNFPAQLIWRGALLFLSSPDLSSVQWTSGFITIQSEFSSFPGIDWSCLTQSYQ